MAELLGRCPLTAKACEELIAQAKQIIAESESGWAPEFRRKRRG